MSSAPCVRSVTPFRYNAGPKPDVRYGPDSRARLGPPLAPVTIHRAARLKQRREGGLVIAGAEHHDIGVHHPLGAAGSSAKRIRNPSPAGSDLAGVWRAMTSARVENAVLAHPPVEALADVEVDRGRSYQVIFCAAMRRFGRQGVEIGNLFGKEDFAEMADVDEVEW